MSRNRRRPAPVKVEADPGGHLAAFDSAISDAQAMLVRLHKRQQQIRPPQRNAVRPSARDQ